MSKHYSWAFATPIRKVFYNLTIISLPVFVALSSAWQRWFRSSSRFSACAAGRSTRRRNLCWASRVT